MAIGRILYIPERRTDVGLIMNAAVFDENEILEEDVNMANSKLLWDNFLRAVSLTATNNNENIINVHDQIVTQTWDLEAGTTDVTVDFTDARDVDCFGIIALTQVGSCTIEIYHTFVDLANKITDVSGDMRVPRMLTFDTVRRNRFIIRIINGGQIRIGQMALSEAMSLPTAPTLGMELGKFNNADEVQNAITTGTALARSTLNPNVRPSVFPYEAVPIQWLRDNWINFANNHTGGLVWFLWDSILEPNDTVFGTWEANNIRYDNSTFTNLRLTITGLVE